MWPLEAKVLETPSGVSDYVGDVRQQFLTCRYAPFCGEGAMMGYLLSGATDDAFKNIEQKVPCTLTTHPKFGTRAHRISRHDRTVPLGKSYPADFLCHHLMLEFLGLQRDRPA
jgi:hypothetical protein